MRIVLVSPSTLPLQTGNSILAERLKTGLSARGHDVKLFNVTTDNPEGAATLHPDIVHSLHATKPAAWLRQLFSRQAPPWVITLTGTDYNTYGRNGLSEEVLRESLDMAAAIVVFHDAAYAALQVRFPQYASKMHINPQGIDLIMHATTREAVREKHGLTADDIIFLMASGMRPVKNIGYALEAFAEIEKKMPRARLVLAGPELDSNEAARIRTSAERLSRFVYLGQLPHAEIRRLMFASDVFVNTSLHEGMPGAVLEAMAESLPLIATATAGNTQLVEDGVNGLLVGLDAREELVSAAFRLVANPNLRAELGNRGKQKAAQYPVARELDGYEILYKKVLSTQC
jgi:glycosyltransferase involved in cell wall biosynthesis